MGAYALSKKYFPHRTFWTFIIVFTMFFSGGLIPTYLLVKDLGLINRYAAMILPSLVSAFNLVIMRNFFSSIPDDYEESCMIDGANRFVIFFTIIVPLSMPILATVGLWLVVGHWNSWFDVLLYIQDDTKFTLQIILRRIILSGTQQLVDMTTGGVFFEETNSSPEGLKAASIYIATIPILCTYPYIQKYFVKGIMIGSLKG
jgi:putative aldouronate transport system permease protein